jgi:outer membrane protein assembly factor BamB
MRMSSVLFFLILIGGCCKDDICLSTPDPCAIEPCGDSSKLMGKLDTLWTIKLLESGKSPGDQRSIHIQKDHIFLTYSNAPIGMIASYDASQNGKRLWLFNQGERGFISSFISNDGKILINKTWSKRISIDLFTGEPKELFKSNSASSPRGILIGDYLYYDETENEERIAHLRRSPILNLSETETVYTLTNDIIKNDKKSIESVNLWMHPQSGDSILIFQHRMALPNRVDVVAWNLSKSELLWKRENVTRDGNSNHQQIFLHDNKAYFGGSVTFFCFDMFTGDIVWQYEAPSGQTPYMITKPTYAESVNAIILVGGEKMTAHDIRNGRIIWQVDSPGSINSGSPIYHDKIIYTTISGGLLNAYRAINGQVVWSERSSKTPFETTSFRGEIAIDREKGILYVTDQDELFAIKVYKE